MIEGFVEELRDYLPYEYSSEEAQEYIHYVTSACIDNANNGKYQFSYLAFHLLYMCFIYKTIWQANSYGLPHLTRYLDQYEQHIFPFDSPFRLSKISEKETIKFLRSHGFHSNKTDAFEEPINHRDKCAHASGFIQYKEEAEFQGLLEKTMTYVREIQAKQNPLLKNALLSFFTGNYKPKAETESYFPSGFESVDRLLKDKMLSSKDIEYIISVDYPFLRQESITSEIIYQKVFYLLVIGKLENDGQEISARVADKMPLLQNGFSKQDKIKMEDLLEQELADIKPLLGGEAQ